MVYAKTGRSNLSVSRICLGTMHFGGIAEDQKFGDFEKLCREIGEKESAVAIAWVLANPAVYSAIVGIRTVEQLGGLDRASEISLSPEVMERLDVIFDINNGRPFKRGPAPNAFAW